MSVERTVPRQCKLDCRGLVRVAVVSVERTIPRQSFLTTSVAENQLSRYSPFRGTVRLPTVVAEEDRSRNLLVFGLPDDARRKNQ